MSSVKKSPPTLGRRIAAPTARIAPAPPPAPPKLSPPPFIRLDAENQRAKVRPSTKRADYEGGWQRVIVPTQGNTRVFSTTRRWRGVDVYIGKPDFEAIDVLSHVRIKIFAVIEGMDRVLVSTGVYVLFSDPAYPVLPSTWVAGARCAADRFEVELSFNSDPTQPGVDRIDVGVIAGDELVELPEMLGAVSSQNSTSLSVASVVSAPPLVAGDPGYEVLLAHSTMIAGAAPRWLHLHDMTFGVDPTGVTPRFSYGMPAIGYSVNDASPGLRTARFRKGLTIVASEMGGVSDPIVDAVAHLVWFR